MIKRTTKKHIQNILAENKNWNVLDIGCGYSANEYANTICDIQDLSEFYKDKKFVQLKNNQLPFENSQFDFVIASHVMEHVQDLSLFISELERISKKGYIEVPSKLEDNLVFENKKEHLWHMEFDDVNLKLLISKKVQFIEPILTVSTVQKLRNEFRSSLVLELYWEKNIDHKFEDTYNKNQKYSHFTLLRKYFSKKIRSVFN